MHCRSTYPAVLLVLLGTAVACSGDASPAPDADSGAPDTPDAAAGDGGPSTPTADPPSPIPRPARVDTRDCQLPGTRSDSLPRGELRPVDVAPLDDAVSLAPTGDGFLVARRGGTIVRATRAGDGYAVSSVGDLSGRGLLRALALHPDDGGLLFVHYVAQSSPPRSVVARFALAADGQLELASERRVVEVAYRDDDATRFGGALLFDAAGMLIVGIGDGGALGADYGDAQDPMRLAGKLLRLDVGGLDAGPALSPPDNPFVDDVDARPEIFARGLRDPRGCALNPQSGELFCVDVGERGSELDVVRGGDDLGWPERDGNFCVRTGELCLDEQFTRPVAVRSHNGLECGMVGVAFQHGDAPELMAGIAFHGDACGPWLTGHGEQADGRSRQDEVARAGAGLAAIGRDERGQLLVIDAEGGAFTLALAADGTPGTFPELLSATGCYADLSRFEPAAEMIGYAVASPLWTDGAHKRRWLAVPAGARIEAPGQGPWTFPDGTILMKEFALALADDPQTLRPVETRFMVKRHGRWEFHGYRWNGAATEAELVFEHATVTYETAGGGAQDYQFPDRGACATCHGDAPGEVLGPRTEQLNLELDYDDGVDNQLAVLDGLQLLSGMDAAPAALAALPDPADGSFPIAERARSYLHGNCAHCHQPGGWTPPDLTLDLRYDRSLAQTATCDVPNQYVEPDRMRIEPGAPERSSLLSRMLETGLDRMPPVASTVVDPLGTALVRDWIVELECQ